MSTPNVTTNPPVVQPPQQPPIHVDPAPPQPTPIPEPTKHTVKKFRILVHGEIDVAFDPNTDEEALKEATIKEIKQKIPDFIITRVLVSESAGPIGNLT